AGRGRPAVLGDARAHPPDRGEGAAQAQASVQVAQTALVPGQLASTSPGAAQRRDAPGSPSLLGYTRMPAFVWVTNHRMWKVVEPVGGSWDVLKPYVTDPCAYVYWSTPRQIDEIKAGDTAYIFRSVDRPGIVARGVVEEAPRHLSATASFAFPPRLTPAGW